MMIPRIFHRIVTRVRFLPKIISRKKYPVELHPITHSPRGRVLISYLAQSVHLSEDSSALNAHSNVWESREIARILRDLSYEVDVINWNDRKFIPETNYDVLFDIAINLSRLSEVNNPPTINILHRTGSDPNYQNAAEMRRVLDVNRRRNANYQPKRIVQEPEIELESLRLADYCSLLGNDHTLRTYPSEYHDKITLVPVSGSYLGESMKSPKEFVPDEREFVWFFGSGAVHKGLDLVLEVFARNPELTLNIIGNISTEEDFLEIYAHELKQMSNIKYHGWLNPSSREFRSIVNRAFSFVAPSCSEGISSAVVTCMQIGLFPIVSRDTGVSLPNDCGIYLETCNLDEIESSVQKAHSLSASSLTAQILETQTHALREYSRNRFREAMKQFIIYALVDRGIYYG